MVDELFAEFYGTMWLCYFAGIATGYAIMQMWSVVKERRQEAIRLIMLSKEYDGELCNECNCGLCLEVRAQIRGEDDWLDYYESIGEGGTEAEDAYMNGWCNGIEDEGMLVEECYRTDEQRSNTW